jgi:hypothetical protein
VFELAGQSNELVPQLDNLPELLFGDGLDDNHIPLVWPQHHITMEGNAQANQLRNMQSFILSQEHPRYHATCRLRASR